MRATYVLDKTAGSVGTAGQIPPRYFQEICIFLCSHSALSVADLMNKIVKKKMLSAKSCSKSGSFFVCELNILEISHDTMNNLTRGIACF